ncbi:MAG TPA: laminin B domain-containing protein [Lacipirellulaceae bacterium]|jgi:hypothetical protein|nr:laminin B domain-containing protein [Lacipirellulaceae bacterium]
MVSVSLAQLNCRRSIRLCLALAILFTASPAAHAIQLASSSFSTNDEGWLVAGDSQSSLPTYVATGGNPGGFVRGFDQTVGGVWLWSAPAKFLGNMSSAYGFPLTYDLRMRGDPTTFVYSDVILMNGIQSVHLGLTPPYPQDVIWTSYSAQLDDTAAWHTDSITGPLATAAQIKSVLANLTSLQIRGEFISGADNGDLDNVVLNGALPGDYNRNGVVDAADYVLWRDTLGQAGTNLAADGNGNGMVDAGDFDVWRSHFSRTAASGTALDTATVPEPQITILGIISLCFVAGFRRTIAFGSR